MGPVRGTRLVVVVVVVVVALTLVVVVVVVAVVLVVVVVVVAVVVVVVEKNNNVAKHDCNSPLSIVVHAANMPTPAFHTADNIAKAKYGG